MSSLESQTIVPTLTMLGLVSEWIWLLAMAGAAVTRSLLPLDQRRACAGVRQPRVDAPASLDRAARHSRGVSCGSPAELAARRADGPLGPFTPAASSPGEPFSLADRSCWSSPPACTSTGVLRLRRRGDRWPVARTVLFLVPGLGSIALVTVSGLEAYDTTLLSVHMVQHMVLSMIAPIFLALGAPVTLALRTLPPPARARCCWRCCTAGWRGAAPSRWSSFGLFVASPFVLYFTGLYRLTLRARVVHELVHVALRRRRLPVLLAADRARPGARAGGRTRCGRC